MTQTHQSPPLRAAGLGNSDQAAKQINPENKAHFTRKQAREVVQAGRDQWFRAGELAHLRSRFERALRFGVDIVGRVRHLEIYVCGHQQGIHKLGEDRDRLVARLEARFDKIEVRLAEIERGRS